MLQASLTVAQAETRAKTMFQKIFDFKFLPPGRGSAGVSSNQIDFDSGLWAMGSPLTEDDRLRTYAALNNCAFVSTEVIQVILISFLTSCAANA